MKWNTGYGVGKSLHRDEYTDDKCHHNWVADPKHDGVLYICGRCGEEEFVLFPKKETEDVS